VMIKKHVIPIDVSSSSLQNANSKNGANPMKNWVSFLLKS
jgi:hypothetical protein